MTHSRRKCYHALVLALIVLFLAGCQPGWGNPGPAPTPPVGSSRPELYVEPEDGRAPLLTLIETAKSNLDLTIYLFTDDIMAAALEQAAARGVHVRVLLESAPYGGGEQNIRTANRLRHAGIDVRYTSPSFRFTHQKSLVVDGRAGVIMTHNLTNSSFSRNREYGVIIRDPDAIAEMKAVFEADWERRTPSLPPDSRLVWSPVNARQKVLALIGSAKDRLDLEHQNLQDRAVVDALVAAAQRGVAVRILMPTPEENERPDVNRIQRAGGDVAFMDVPRVHAKVLVVDRKQALIGSMNLTATSLDLNRELGILIDEPEVLVPLLATMAEDWGRASARPPASTPASGTVLPEQAINFVGQEVTVEGTVVNTYDTGKVTFLDFTKKRGGFTAVIFAGAYGRFPAPPAEYYANRRVRVRGRVQLYQGAAEIIVRGPDQIVVLDTGTPTPTPVPESPPSTPLATPMSGTEAPSPVPQQTPTAGSPAEVTWQEAENRVGEVVTVVGTVVNTYDTGKVTFLDFTHERGRFVAIVFADDYEQFAEPPATAFRDKRVAVTGKVQLYRGRPEIVISGPDQIRVEEP